jgi:hypothetical protein
LAQATKHSRELMPEIVPQRLKPILSRFSRHG